MKVIIEDGEDIWEVNQLKLGWSAHLNSSRIYMRADSFGVLLDKIIQRHSGMQFASIAIPNSRMGKGPDE